jgi:hypothetical protein
MLGEKYMGFIFVYPCVTLLLVIWFFGFVCALYCLKSNDIGTDFAMFIFELIWFISIPLGLLTKHFGIRPVSYGGYVIFPDLHYSK